MDDAEAVTSERKIICYILVTPQRLGITSELTLCAHTIFAYIKRKLRERKMPSKTSSGSYLSWMRELRGSIWDDHLD